MTKKRYLILFLILIVALIILGLPYMLGNFLLGGTSSELISESVSPDGEYTIHAYRINAGATVDYSIEAYLMNTDNKEKRIYNAYHEREADIIWIDNQKVNINGKILDLSLGETYDWRKQGQEPIRGNQSDQSGDVQ